jgi:hypothetical protein
MKEKINIKTYQSADYQGVLSVLKDCYAGIDDNYASAEDMMELSASYPEGQILACIGDEVVGIILSLLVSYDKVTKAPNMSELYDPTLFKKMGENGDSLFALEILVKSTHKRKGIGKILNETITKVLINNNLKAFIGVSRLSGYGAVQHEMSVETYIEKVVNGELQDPSLSYNCHNGMLPQRAIPQYYPPDIASAGYGALVIQKNKNYMDASLMNILSGKTTFMQLPENELLTTKERENILTTLEKTPYTFEYPSMPHCWGKAFENYLSMEEYFEPYQQDESVATLCAPIIQRIKALLEGEGISVFELEDPIRKKAYTVGDFRRMSIEANSTMLHIDDIRNDGLIKSDFIMPTVLTENPYVQSSLLIHLADKGRHATLRLYDKDFQVSDSQFIQENGWQFSEDAVKNTSFTDFIPSVGDAFIMRNQCFHDVLGGNQSTEWLIYSTYIVYVPNLNHAYLFI